MQRTETGLPVTGRLAGSSDITALPNLTSLHGRKQEPKCLLWVSSIRIAAMSTPSLQRVHRALALIGGCLTAIGLLFTLHLMYVSFWIFSKGQDSGDVPNLLAVLEGQKTIAPLAGVLLTTFLVGCVTTYWLITKPLQSFFAAPSQSRGLPWKGFLAGLRCGLGNCVTVTSLGTIAGIIYDSFEHTITIDLLLLGPLAFSLMALFYVGIPVSIISGSIGSLTELILRRLYRHPATQA